MATPRTTVPLPVRRVVVLEDRAQVEREGSLLLPAGRCLLRVEGFTPVCADKTLTAQVRAGEGRVVDLRVERRARARLLDKPEDLRRRQQQREEAQAALQRLADRLARVEDRVHSLDEQRRQLLAEVQEDAAWSRLDTAAWTEGLRQLDRAEDAALEQRRALVAERAHLQRRLSDLERLVDTLDGPGARMEATLLVELALDEPGEVLLAVGYVVPGACWRPQHRASLAGGRLHLETCGVTWQHTGEDWSEVELSLSTRRASLGTEPPLLGEDELHTRPRQEQVVVEARDQAIETTGLGGGATTTGGLPGIDDGGEVRTLRVPGRPTVRADGRPHRLPLSSFDGDAQVELVAMPERARAVIRRVRATHQGSAPLLAGPVELVADGGPAGRTTLLYVAPGERFELGFGPDPALRVHRKADRVEHEPGVLSRWATTTHRVRLHLSNLGVEPRTVELVERIPISEVEQVRVELERDACSAGAQPDADGMVRWTLALPPGGTAERVLAWRVEKKKDVVGL